MVKRLFLAIVAIIAFSPMLISQVWAKDVRKDLEGWVIEAIDSNKTVYDKTVADTVEKALAKDLFLIAEKLERIAPGVWKTLIKQQYIKAFSTLVLPWGVFSLFFFLATTMITKVQKKKIDEKNVDTGKKDKEEEKKAEEILSITIIAVICIIICIASGIIGIWRIPNALGYIINPKYYAVKDFLMMSLN